MDARALQDAVADKLIAHDKESGFPCPSYNCTADIAVDAVLAALAAEGLVIETPEDDDSHGYSRSDLLFGGNWS